MTLFQQKADLIKYLFSSSKVCTDKDKPKDKVEIIG